MPAHLPDSGELHEGRRPSHAIPLTPEGILLIDKPAGRSSFSLIPSLRKHLNVQKIGHAGTLDPFATGLLVFLIGRSYTKLADTFLADDKEYLATLHLGQSRDTYDCDGIITSTSEKVPTEGELVSVIELFQGEQLQIPPMFSAKKVAGQRLYKAARQGQVIERKAVPIRMQIELMSYSYPRLALQITCSKGTYIRSLAHDLGKALGTGAYVSHLRRIRSGRFHIDAAVSFESFLHLSSNACAFRK